MSAILQEDPPELSDSNVAISPGIDRVIRRCMEKIPDRRFQSASDLGFAIETLSRPSGASAALRAMAKPTRRRWTALVVVVALAALAVAFAVGLRVGRLPLPAFRQLVSGPGMISSARFAPDGQNVVYYRTAGWVDHVRFSPNGDAIGFLDHPMGPRGGAGLLNCSPPVSTVSNLVSLALPPADVTGISQGGDMLILLGWHSRYRWNMSGTLARTALSGGTPQPLLEDVCGADIERQRKRSGGGALRRQPADTGVSGGTRDSNALMAAASAFGVAS